MAHGKIGNLCKSRSFVVILQQQLADTMWKKSMNSKEVLGNMEGREEAQGGVGSRPGEQNQNILVSLDLAESCSLW